MCMRISMAHAVQHTCRKFSCHYQSHVDRKAVHQAAEGGAFLVKIEKNDEPAFLRAKVQLANFIKASTPRSKPTPALTSPPVAQSA